MNNNPISLSSRYYHSYENSMNSFEKMRAGLDSQNQSEIHNYKFPPQNLSPSQQQNNRFPSPSRVARGYHTSTGKRTCESFSSTSPIQRRKQFDFERDHSQGDPSFEGNVSPENKDVAHLPAYRIEELKNASKSRGKALLPKLNSPT